MCGIVFLILLHLIVIIHISAEEEECYVQFSLPVSFQKPGRNLLVSLHIVTKLSQ